MSTRRNFLKKIGYIFLLFLYPLKIVVRKKGTIFWILKKGD